MSSKGEYKVERLVECRRVDRISDVCVIEFTRRQVEWCVGLKYDSKVFSPVSSSKEKCSWMYIYYSGHEASAILYDCEICGKCLGHQ